MTDAEFYSHVMECFWIIGHCISLFLGFIFGIVYWRELFR